MNFSEVDTNGLLNTGRISCTRVQLLPIAVGGRSVPLTIVIPLIIFLDFFISSILIKRFIRRLLGNVAEMDREFSASH